MSCKHSTNISSKVIQKIVDKSDSYRDYNVLSHFIFAHQVFASPSFPYVQISYTLIQTCHSGLAQNQYKWQGKSVFFGENLYDLRKYKEISFAFLKNLYFAKFYKRKSVFCQNLRVKNLYILIKSVWVASLLILQFQNWCLIACTLNKVRVADLQWSQAFFKTYHPRPHKARLRTTHPGQSAVAVVIFKSWFEAPSYIYPVSKTFFQNANLL